MGLKVSEDKTKSSEKFPQYLLDFALSMRDLQEVAERLRRYLIDVADELSVRPQQVEARAKSFDSFRKKSAKVQEETQEPVYENPLQEIEDMVAARIIVFTDKDKEQIHRALSERFACKEDRNVGADREIGDKNWGYDSVHLIVTGFSGPGGPKRLSEYFVAGQRVEIQIRTVASHAWAEYEHDVRYKAGAGYRSLGARSEAKREIDKLFAYAAFQFRQMDATFAEIESHLAGAGANETVPNADGTSKLKSFSAPSLNSLNNDRPFDVDSLGAFLKKTYPGARGSQGSALAWMIEILGELGLNCEPKLEKVLADSDSDRVASLMDYRRTPTVIRRLDDDLLALLEQSYIDQTHDVADTDELRKRREAYLPLRLVTLAGKYKIYRVGERTDGTLALTEGMTAAATVRTMVGMALEVGGIDLALVPGYIARDPASTRDPLRAREWAFELPDGPVNLWIVGGLSRAEAEQVMLELREQIGTKAVEVLRAGDQLFEPLLFLRQGEREATGRQTTDGFVVLRGSEVDRNVAQSTPARVQAMREQVALDDENRLVQTTFFTSPSAASSFVTGSSSSGQQYWKDSNGTPLGALGTNRSDSQRDA